MRIRVRSSARGRWRHSRSGCAFSRPAPLRASRRKEMGPEWPPLHVIDGLFGSLDDVLQAARPGSEA